MERISSKDTPQQHRPHAQMHSEAWLFQRAFAHVERQLNKTFKRIALRLQQHEERLSASQNWHQVHHQAELLQSNLFKLHRGMNFVLVADWEKEEKEVRIPLDPLVEPSAQVKQLFRESRKLRSAEPHLLKQIALAKEQLAAQGLQLEQLSAVTNMEQLQQFCTQHHVVLEKTPPPAPSKKPVPRLPYTSYTSISGVQIWVGKSAKDNDLLTFHHAHGSDFWLHVRDYPGSHIVLRCPKNQQPDDGAIQDAVELAVRFSKCKGDAEVCLTQVKFIKKVHGVPGRVMVSKHRNLLGKLDSMRWERLKHSKLPLNGV
jgi:predicted ribosome quality control (RQC) complex YloA/Tae2 family protein